MSDTFAIAVTRLGRPVQQLELAAGVYRIGADDEDNHLVLPDRSVSPRHAVMGLQPNACWIEDLASERGTYLEGERVSGRANWTPGQSVALGAFVLHLEPDTAAAEPPPPPQPLPPPAPPAPPPAPPMTSGAREIRRAVKRQIHTELLARLDLKRLTAARIGAADLQAKARETLAAIIRDVQPRLPAGMTPDELLKEVYDEALGLGPLEDLLADPSITEIMVNGASQIYIERQGKLLLTEKMFVDDASVQGVIERIVSPIGRRIDESQPYVDARLPDGSRVNAIIPPLSLIGPCLTIRKFSQDVLSIADLIRFGTLTQPLADFLDACVKLRKNMVISGGTGSGKTTLLNVVSNFLPTDERIITIEDAAELRLALPHVLRQEARPPNLEGRGAISIRDLVRNALRMRPDRIVVGECRGGEALDMLQAMNTGHEGSLTTVHANSPRDVISRLETMVLMSGMELPLRAIREQLGAALDLIVHTARYSDGVRRVGLITEIVGLEGEQITMQDLFEFHQQGLDSEGRVQGSFRPTGNVPTFLEAFRLKGIALDQRLFDPRVTWDG